jgi:hypothetical protein
VFQLGQPATQTPATGGASADTQVG